MKALLTRVNCSQVAIPIENLAVRCHQLVSVLRGRDDNSVRGVPVYIPQKPRSDSNIAVNRDFD